jgi:hypothetical protein
MLSLIWDAVVDQDFIVLTQDKTRWQGYNIRIYATRTTAAALHLLETGSRKTSGFDYVWLPKFRKLTDTQGYTSPISHIMT